MHTPNVAEHFKAGDLKPLSSVTVELTNLPNNVTTREIYNSMARLRLCITRIDILDKNARDRCRRARVIIEPVPRDWPPWGRSSGFFTLKRSEGQPPVKVHVGVLSTRGIHDTVKTPLDMLAPREHTIRPQGLLFGMMADEGTMYEMPQYNYQGVGLSIQFFRRFIEFTFGIGLQRTGVKLYKIPIKFTHIKKLIRISHEDGTWALVICLPSPPEIFMKLTDAIAIQQTHDDELPFWQEKDLWLRQSQISHKPHLAKNLPKTLENRPENLNIGRWTTYYFRMSPESLRSWELVESRLTDYDIKVEHPSKFRLVKPSQITAWTLLAANDINKSSRSTSNADLLGSTQNIILPFEVRYQLEACISQGLLCEHSIDACFLKKLTSFGTERARMMLEGVADGNVPYYQPMAIFDEPKILNYWPSAKVPPHAAMIRKVVVTPTTMYVKTPTVELTNRVLRQYSDLNDNFLRVQFTDEVTFGKIWSDQVSKKSDELYLHVHRVLRNGIVAGGRHFHLLAWSNSQFREHGAFFFCPTPHVTCDDIRDWMGDFKHIESVGKFTARMGQCFTTTRQVSGIGMPKIMPISDIKIKKNGKKWTFTDGAGKISTFYAQMIAHDHNLPDTPSCLQVRIAGSKGILVVWPDVPSGEVHIRPSQQKFQGPYNGIEVIKVSRYSHATLNKQIIPILNCLGVEDDVFIDLLEEELKDYDEAMCSSIKAAELLRHRVDENQITLVMAEMVEAFMDTKEPFLHTMLHLWKCWALQRLKQKAAISVKKSAFLYGCVDEAGVLRGYSEDQDTKAKNVDSLPQIFLQVPIDGSEAPNATSYRVITGVCVVGRNPSLHPGDVRVVEAVDHAKLRHLRDVVVFPQKGDRDIPSMCSGGDLDGDDYFIIWDQRLIPTEWNFKPMDHDADDAKPSKTAAVTMEHVCSFFAQYMKNDSLGLIATAHVAWADKVGPKHTDCIELAKLHSKAVDYVKSGSPAVMHKRLNPKSFPHFTERTSKTYRSEKPLGRIYDRVKTVRFDPIYDMAFDGHILSRFDLSANELTKAREVKGKYDIAMRRLMGRHENPVTEFEIWSTFILSKPRVGSDYKLREEVGREVASLKDRFRSICAEAVTGIERKDMFFSYSLIDLEKLDRFVAAMYTVTHDEVEEALRARESPVIDDDGNKIADDQGSGFPMPLISFPWLFHRELSRISAGGRPPTRQWKQACDGSQTVTTAASGPQAEPDTEATSQPAACVTSSVIMEDSTIARKKEGDEGEDQDYVRTSSGQIIYRGETLDLFHTLTPSSPQSAKDKDKEEEAGELPDEIQFEEVEVDNEEDMEEDALDALTRLIGGI